MSQLSRLGLHAALAGTAALGAAVLMPAPEARAACLGGDSVCTQFSVASDSTPTDIGGFTGTGVGSIAYNGLGIEFSLDGGALPFTIENILLKGDGIAPGGLAFSNLQLTPPSPSTSAVYTTTILPGPVPSGTALDFSNYNLSFKIPAGLTEGTKISARIFAGQGIGSFAYSSSFTTEAVPGPLSILGAGVAFGFSRRLRRRIAESA